MIKELVDKNGNEIVVGATVAFIEGGYVELGKVTQIPDQLKPPPQLYYESDIERYSSAPFPGARAMTLDSVPTSGIYYVHFPDPDPIRIRRLKIGTIASYAAKDANKLVVLDEKALFTHCI